MRYESIFWTTELRALYNKAVRLYGEGNREVEAFFSKEEMAFLSGIGLSSMNLYDYAEDFLRSQEPDWETVLLMAAARRDYFLHVQHGIGVSKEVTDNDLPSREAETAGIAWLPRVIVKAHAYLEGTLCPDIMYCCGGDRKFFRAHGAHPADFLRVVWSAGDDNNRVVAFVQQSSRRVHAH